MSELTIIGTSPADPLNPDYPLELPPLPEPDDFVAESGEFFTRQRNLSGRVIPLSWSRRPKATADALRQMFDQHRNGGFVSFHHIENDRYFSGNLRGLRVSQSRYEGWDISATFYEQAGRALYAYPSNWARDAVFMEERDDYGNDLVKLIAGWTWFPSNGERHGAGTYQTNVQLAAAEWNYLGYGFRVWSIKHPSLGLFAVLLDGVLLDWQDLYAPASQISSPVYTRQNVPLGLHRVQLICTGEKNPLATGYAVEADAIEVMR